MKDKLYRRIEDGMTTYKDADTVRWRMGMWFMTGIVVGLILVAIRVFF